ncbi:MAG: transglutaminase-like domain-containing protein [Chitinophagales bacterium]
MRSCFYCIYIVVLLSACNNGSRDEGLTYEEYQLHAANLVAQPKYSGDSMLYRLTGADARLEMFYTDTRTLYFTCEKDKVNEVLSKLVIHKDSIEMARQNGDKLELDNKVYHDLTKAFFKCAAANLRVDTARFIQIPYGNAVYRITLPQIVDFITMKSNLRGGAFAITPNKEMMVSHGVAVSKKGEPSLTDLVRQLTSMNQTTEVKAQKLLDFVANQIEYNEREAFSGTETIKRPDEILFTRNSDCSGKTILYASLLQQINCKWCILYYDRHVCVGVTGNYHPVHAASIDLKGVTYYIAETTAPNAVIGENAWGTQMLPSSLKFYQIPEEGEEIIDYISGKPLQFLKKTVSE